MNKNGRSKINSKQSSEYLFSKRKRLMDITIASLGMVVLTLVLPFVWVALKSTSKGPLFYSRKRSGRDGKPFNMVKFRTMKVGSDADVNNLRTAPNDSRVTGVGSWLRQMYIDEFPQFWNVIKGDMSIVGPRPEFPELAKKLESKDEAFRSRLIAKPGITGYAQTEYPHAHNEKMAMRRLRYDMQYIKRANFKWDVAIYFRTFVKLMKISNRFRR